MFHHDAGAQNRMKLKLLFLFCSLDQMSFLKRKQKMHAIKCLQS